MSSVTRPAVRGRVWGDGVGELGGRDDPVEGRRVTSDLADASGCAEDEVGGASRRTRAPAAGPGGAARSRRATTRSWLPGTGSRSPPSPTPRSGGRSRPRSRSPLSDAATAAAATVVGGLLSPDGALGRSWKDSRAVGHGVLEDYTHLADGLLALYEATFDERWFTTRGRWPTGSWRGSPTPRRDSSIPPTITSGW